jgi:hypothetical protein
MFAVFALNVVMGRIPPKAGFKPAISSVSQAGIVRWRQTFN